MESIIWLHSVVLPWFGWYLVISIIIEIVLVFFEPMDGSILGRISMSFTEHADFALLWLPLIVYGFVNELILSPIKKIRAKR